MNKKRMRILVVLLITAVLGATIVFAKTLPKENDKKDDKGFMSNLKELKEISEIMDVVRENFVGEKEVTREQMMHGAVKGIVESLGDSHTNYFSKEEMQSFTEDIKGEYAGVGMVVGKRDKVLEVVSPIEDTPAFAAGMKSKDLIIEIDGKPTPEMTLEKCVETLKGAANTKVKILVFREGVQKPFEVTLTRAVIKLKYVKYKMLDSEIGYLRLTQFGENVSIDLRKAAKDLIENQKAKGIILDLRNNPGGSLQEAVGVASIFIDKSKIVTIRDKGGNEEVYNSFAGTTKENKAYTDLPLIVLVNEGSASASEIVSGAVKDLKRGILLGEKTYGKGSVQNLLPLKDGDGIKLTIAKYFTPSGVCIDKKGIEPDVKVIEENDGEFFDGYITNLEITDEKLKDKNKEEKKTITSSAVTTEGGVDTAKKSDKEKKKDDKQLNTAIGILKGLIIYKK